MLAWAGAVAVFIGVVFFLATALRRGWIDEPTRVVLAYLGSTALLGAGLYLYDRKGRTAGRARRRRRRDRVALRVDHGRDDALRPGRSRGRARRRAPGGRDGDGDRRALGLAELAGVGIVGAMLSPVLVDAGTSGVALAFMAVALVSAAGVLLWKRWTGWRLRRS